MEIKLKVIPTDLTDPLMDRSVDLIMNLSDGLPQNLNLIETFDKLKLGYIIFNFSEFEDGLRWKPRYHILPPTKIIKKYLINSTTNLEFCKDNGDSADIDVYYYKKDRRGRMQASESVSLQAIPREIRHTIAKEFYNDIDMVNAHPVILQWMCRGNNIKCPKLDSYIKSRDKWIKKTGVNRDAAKTMFLSLTNGGNQAYKDIIYEFNQIRGLKSLENTGGKILVFVNNYKLEMIRLHKYFASKEYPLFVQKDFDKMVESRKSKGRDYNHEAAYMNMILRDMENLLLIINVLVV